MHLSFSANHVVGDILSKHVSESKSKWNETLIMKHILRIATVSDDDREIYVCMSTHGGLKPYDSISLIYWILEWKIIP